MKENVHSAKVKPVWEKMAMHEPAGTIEMKPPEVSYNYQVCILALYIVSSIFFSHFIELVKEIL